MKHALEFFRFIFHDIDDAVLISTSQGNVIYMNPSASALTGYFADETDEVTASQLLPEAAKQTLQETTGTCQQTVLAREDGSLHETDLHWNRVEFAGECYVRHLLRTRKMHRNPDEMNSSASAPGFLAASPVLNNTASLLLMNLMENMTDNIYFKDVDSRFIMVNKAFCRWTLLDPAMMLGKSDFDLFAKAHAQKAYDDEQRIIATGIPMIGIEEKELWPDGHSSWVSTTKLPLRNSAGEIIGTFGISRDITDRKAMEDELRDAHNKAKQATEAKSAFLANMSHEIRTPLNAVVGMSDMLEDTPLNHEQREYVETINTSSEVLLDIVDNILDLAKVEAGKLDIETVPFNLVQTVEKTVDVLARKAAENGLELMHYFHGPMPEIVFGDPTRLRQVLLNLLSNSIKFTPTGEILVTVEGIPLDDQHYHINFTVTDSGIGMTEEEIRRVLQPYEQADSSVTRKYGGTGLGLSICKTLVEMMGGAMTIRSEKNEGSEFKFYIIVRKSNDAVGTEPWVDTTILKGRRVLVVDDNATSLRILKHELEKALIDPVAFLSAAEAMEQLDTLGPLDMAILDYTMPDMNGGSLAKALRTHSTFGTRPILALSSSGYPRKTKGSTIDCWMTKPVKGRHLRETLADLLGDNPNNPALANKDNPLHGKLLPQYPHRILLAEDNTVNQVVTLRMLSKLGYEADVVSNGQDAVAAVTDHAYDLVLMDVQMPVMDGLEASRIIREQVGNGHGPVIIGLSAHATKESRDKALHCGMDGYLSKPVRTADLMQILPRK